MAYMLEPMKWVMGLEIPGPACSFWDCGNCIGCGLLLVGGFWTFVGLLGFGLADKGRGKSGMFLNWPLWGGLRVRICFFGTIGGLVWLDIDSPVCEWWDTCYQGSFGAVEKG
jgi:hypothetical protein